MNTTKIKVKIGNEIKLIDTDCHYKDKNNIFAITKSGCAINEYTVTHIKTGYAVSCTINDLKVGRAKIKRLKALPVSWNELNPDSKDMYCTIKDYCNDLFHAFTINEISNIPIWEY